MWILDNTKAWDRENKPITAGTKFIPDIRPLKPNTNRGYPESKSEPIVLKNKPIDPAINPLIKLPDESVPIIVKPNTANIKYCAGPNFKEIKESGGAINKRANPLIIPPNTDAKVEILIAVLNFPASVRT